MTIASSPAQIFPLAQQSSNPANRPGDRWRPGPFQDPEIDLAIKTSFDNVYGLEHTSTQTPDSINGSSVSSGALSVTGSVKAVATGLSTLSNIIVSIDSAGVPHNLTVSATPSVSIPGTFDVAVFKPTAAGNNTPILNTVPTVVRWHAWGTI
jgi:hypothetical protein